MGNEGRFLGKQLQNLQGILSGAAALLEEGGIWSLIGGARVGDGGLAIANIWQTTYTWNVPAIVAGTGSTNAIVAQDVAMSGAAVGDPVLVSPIGSMAIGLLIWGLVHSANNVQLRADYGGTTGAYTAGNVPIKITCIKSG